MHIKVNDMVRVLRGEDREETGKVLVVDHQARKVIVEGVNRVYKHVRRSQRNPQGGRLSKEMPIPLANVMLVCRSCGKPARTGARYTKDGVKERYCKKCGSALGDLAPAKAAHAKKN